MLHTLQKAGLRPAVARRGCVQRVAARSASHSHHATVRPDQQLSPEHPCPDPDEEAEVAHEALQRAMERCKPASMRIKGMQEFASAIWERRRRIPSQTYSDPLDRIFGEFDTDDDGHLSAPEVMRALTSHGVDITEAQVQQFIDAVDTNGNGTIERSEFADFIFRMAVADLRGNTSPSQQSVDSAARSDLHPL